MAGITHNAAEAALLARCGLAGGREEWQQAQAPGAEAQLRGWGGDQAHSHPKAGTPGCCWPSIAHPPLDPRQPRLDGPAWIDISHAGVAVLHQTSHALVMRWPLADVKGYAAKDRVFGIQVRGEGLYFFSTPDPNAAAQALRGCLEAAGKHSLPAGQL